MNPGRLRFYYERLMRSSISEIIHRSQEQIFLRRLGKKPDLYKKDLPECPLQQNKLSSLQFPLIYSDINNDVLSPLLQGEVCTLNQSDTVIDQFERKYRKHLFYRIRQEPAGPDIRAVWEVGRLQNLMVLLQYLACNGSKSEKSGEIEKYVRLRLFEWIQKNPFPYGPHYMSSMECGLRVLVFLRAILLLEELRPEEREILLFTLFQHGWLIKNRLSLYSSLGNHTIAECVGLVMVGAIFIEHRLCRDWLIKGIALLEQECRHQLLDDGGPVEQSFAYHRFVLDLYWLAIHFLTDNNLHDCSPMRRRVRKGEEFLRKIQSENERLPMIGDSDDGFALGPSLSPKREFGSSYSNHQGLLFLPDSGYSVFRCKNGLRLLFDHGPPWHGTFEQPWSCRCTFHFYFS